MEKIGIAICTYNRDKHFIKLLTDVYNNKPINSFIIVVKDKNIEYKTPFLHLCDCYKNPTGNIAHSKNIALDEMIKQGCKHLFLLEDDIIIKDFSIFDQFIKTAKAFNIDHLNFPGEKHTNNYIVNLGEYSLSLYSGICGAFSYYTDTCIKMCGMLDSRFNNCLEHCEHSLRIHKFGYTTGPGYWACINNIEKYIEYYKPVSDISTITSDSMKYPNELEAKQLFVYLHGSNCLNTINLNDTINYLKLKVISKNNYDNKSIY